MGEGNWNKLHHLPHQAPIKYFSPSPAMAISVDPPRFHVLAVDDSLTDRKLIERLLKSSSYQVTAVDSVSKALQFLGLLEEDGSSAPDVDVNLIITDYCMPGMTGFDLLKKIKESSMLKDIPVVVMSSENLPSRINRCLDGGADDFFLKPVQLSDMKRLRPQTRKVDSKDSNVVVNNSNFARLIPKIPMWLSKTPAMAT